MKQIIKKFLLSLNLLDTGRLLYSFLTKVSFSTLTNELEFRKNGLPDHHSSPPSSLIFLVIRSVWAGEYWNSGLTIINDLELQFQRQNISTDKFKRILDFGCGCGRLTRHLTRLKNAELFGTDYNKKLIDWSSASLPFATFSQNNLAPPLLYESKYFDLVLARSVFTHLDLQLQFAWIEELYRIIRPGGYLYFTTHSGASVQSLGNNSNQRFHSEGFVSENSDLQGDNKCAVYQTKEWVFNNLAKGFTIIDYIPGRPVENLGQDIYIFQRPV